MPINSSEGIKHFKELARKVMDVDDARDYNQGIMEFGAMQCAPKKPYCMLCPLQESCVALKDNKVDILPIKLNKTKTRTRYFNYMVFLDSNKNTLLEQRTGKGIWQNLYQFPLLESEKEIHEKELTQHLEDGFPSRVSLSVYNETPVVHKLSHQHLYTRFWIIETKELLSDGISWEQLVEFPVPVLIADFIQTFKI